MWTGPGTGDSARVVWRELRDVKVMGCSTGKGFYVMEMFAEVERMAALGAAREGRHKGTDEGRSRRRT